MDWLTKLFPKKEPKKIFLDYASATPVLPEVKLAMGKYFSKEFYNPSAIYEEGLKVKREIEENRTKVARILGAGSKEVVFTAGGTEADNLAILGVFEEAKKTIPKPHLIISAIEHSAVVRVAEECVRRGGELSVAPVDEEGLVSPETIAELIKKNTVLVSVGLVNSEIGVVQPISRIGRLLKELRKKNNSTYPLLHSDASAAPNYLNINIEPLQCDLLSLDASKIYGPKGAGLLAMKKNIKLHPLIFGGNQEKGLRAGTLNPALIAGLTQALEIAERDREGEVRRLEALRALFVEEVVKTLPTALINGSVKNRLPNILSISIPGILGEFLLLKLEREGLLVSVGTACSLDEKESGSPVLEALGKGDLKESTIRISFGKHTHEKELKEAIKIFCSTVSNMLK